MTTENLELLVAAAVGLVVGASLVRLQVSLSRLRLRRRLLKQLNRSGYRPKSSPSSSLIADCWRLLLLTVSRKSSRSKTSGRDSTTSAALNLGARGLSGLRGSSKPNKRRS